MPKRRYIGMRLSHFCCLVLVFSACVQPPPGPTAPDVIREGAGIYVLNEGLFGRNNASLTFYDRATGSVYQNYFQQVNAGLKLGDTANSLTVFNDLAYVVMNGSNTVEIMEIATAKSRGRIRLQGNPSPREAVILSDTLGFVTALYSDEVIRFNPAAKQETGRIRVGPAPEGLVVSGERLYVANSGLGDIRAAEPGAGTLSVVNWKTLREEMRIPVLRNCTTVRLGPDGLIYVAGTGSYVEEVPTGIAVVDPFLAAVIDTILIPNHPTDFVLLKSGKGFVLTDSAVVEFDWLERRVTRSRFISRRQVGSTVWFSAIAVQEQRNELCVGNARDFVTNGEVVCFDLTGKEIFRFPTKLNPGTILFKP